MEPFDFIFSPWLAWETFLATRLEDRRFRNKGVYLLAHFRKTPMGAGRPDLKEVVYVGETTKQDLKSRLDQFHGSAFQERSGHSGGWTYSKKLLENALPSGALHVSILPITQEYYRHPGYLIKHIERSALWKIIKTIGDPPPCNKS